MACTQERRLESHKGSCKLSIETQGTVAQYMYMESESLREVVINRMARENAVVGHRSIQGMVVCKEAGKRYSSECGGAQVRNARNAEGK